MTNEKRKILNGTLRYVFLIIMALFVLVPVLWMVSTAFKTEAETYSPTPIWIPSEISLASFKKFFGIYNFGSMTMNSLVTCLGSMIICTVFSCLAGYGVTRFIFKGKKSFLGFLLVTQMFPSVMLVVPGIAAVAIFVLINGWNEYMYSSVLISKDALKTLTVGIVSLNTQNQVHWNDMMAASSMSCLPLIILFLCFQKYFIAGMTSGAVKS